MCTWNSCILSDFCLQQKHKVLDLNIWSPGLGPSPSGPWLILFTNSGGGLSFRTCSFRWILRYQLHAGYKGSGIWLQSLAIFILLDKSHVLNCAVWELPAGRRQSWAFDSIYLAGNPLFLELECSSWPWYKRFLALMVMGCFPFVLQHSDTF